MEVTRAAAVPSAIEMTLHPLACTAITGNMLQGQTYEAIHFFRFGAAPTVTTDAAAFLASAYNRFTVDLISFTCRKATETASDTPAIISSANGHQKESEY